MTDEIQVPYEQTHNPGQAAELTPSPPASQPTHADLPGVEVSTDAHTEEQPQTPVREVEDTRVIFVPFEDFQGRINQADFNFRKDIPTKVPKTEANVWLEAKKGYIK